MLGKGGISVSQTSIFYLTVEECPLVIGYCGIIYFRGAKFSWIHENGYIRGDVISWVGWLV